MNKTASEFKIEKNVPFSNEKRSRPPLYPWRDMQVGDSFFVPGKTPKEMSGARMGAERTSKGKAKFKGRCIYKDGEVIGCRIWRVA